MYLCMYTLSTKHTDHYQEFATECPRNKNSKMDLSMIYRTKIYLIESIYKYNLNLYINTMLRGNVKDKYVNTRKVF